MSKLNTMLYPYMSERGPFTVEVPGASKVDGETIPRRHPKAKDQLTTSPGDGVQTLYDLVTRSAAKFGNAKALGSRKLLNTHQETKMIKKLVDGQTKEVEKKWTYYELGHYNYMSFVEYEKLVKQVASGLRKIGLEKGDRVHLFAGTTANWLAMSHGAAFQSMAIATAYDTLGAEGLRHSLVQTQAKAVYTDPSLLKTLSKALESAKEVKTIIYNSDAGEIDHGMIKKLKDTHSHLNILGFEELRKLGEENPVEPVPPSPEDLCCIMYTSGSTGTPKGVQIKHNAIIAAVGGVTTIVGDYFGPGDGLLTYLPSAHIIEYVFENAGMFWGCTLGYGNPRTLTDASVRKCKGDITEFRPSVMVGVPAVWESVRKGILAKIEGGSPIVKNLFWGALAAKTFLMSNGLPGSALLDMLVFNKVREATGGRLRITLNGGGPIAKDTQRFLSMAICPMLGGYGLTETCAMGALMDPLQWTDDAIGVPPSSIEIKLFDFADAGYFSTNTPPQGEIWVRGATVMTEYFENEAETKEAVTADGWFKTGDIGEWDKNGQLKLIDRKKNLVKTLNGEYIALEKLESLYRTSKTVANICVYASPQHSKPIAIVVPVEAVLKKMAEQHKVSGHNLEDFVKSDKLNAVVLKDLQNAGQSSGLAGMEIIEGVVLTDEEWTTANGLLTAAQKIQRKSVLKKYESQVKKAYGDK